PGIVGGFRIPKYAAATDATYPPPGDKPALRPLLDWVRLCASSAADRSALVVATNCDRIVCTAGGSEVVAAAPDRTAYPALPHPPLTIDLSGMPAKDLQFDGYVGDELVITHRMSSTVQSDRLEIAVDDAAIDADGIDATRVVFRAVDAHGNWRSDVTGAVDLSVEGPGQLIGPAHFNWDESPGAAAVWLRSAAGESGEITVIARHSLLGEAAATVHSAATA
ncbi:MAG: hypothetical protein ACR2F6_00040, partial [Mycobacteriales bacterium]